MHVKQLYPELFDDWSTRHQKTPERPNAAADAYLAEMRGFDLPKIRGWYRQESFYDSRLGAGSATVRFALGQDVYWERIIDKPGRFGSQKANFHGGYRGMAWAPPGVAPDQKQVWIVEGIFDAIALLHRDIYAVSIMSSVNFPSLFLAGLAQQCASNEAAQPVLV
ncbi:MAG: toprim domain-containing protein [Betaproteobacteria bacterium]|nr:toprim domain-containing protein [Betaproteobacteria bacterium]